MIDCTRIIKPIKKVWNKNSFIILQLIIILITYLIVTSDILIPWDMYMRNKLIDVRNGYIKNTADYDIKSRKVILVGIDEKFFTNENVSYQGLHRGYYSKVFENILRDDPLSLGIDVFFENKYNFTGSDNDKRIKLLNQIFSTYDRSLGLSLKDSSVLASTYDFNNSKILSPDDIFLQNNPKIGHVHSVEYYNGVNLGVQPLLQDKENGKELLPLSFEVYNNYYIQQQNRLYSGLNLGFSYNATQAGNLLSISLPKKKDDIRVPISSNIDKNSKFLFVPLYVSKVDDLHNYISFYDVYKGNYPKNFFKDKIVYLGSIDSALNDNKSSLKGIIPGVFMHINLTLSSMINDFVYVLSKNELELLIYSFLLINFLMLLIYKNNLKSHSAIFYLLIIEIFMIAIGSVVLSLIGQNNGSIFGKSNISYSIFLPVGTLLFAISVQILLTLVYFLITTFATKNMFQKLFTLYVGDQISDQKTSSNDEDVLTRKVADSKDVAIFFSDIASFTTISEKLTPQENIAFLNEYLEKMSEVIANNGGHIDKYIGDAIMAFWSDEFSCDLAAKSAIGNIMNLGVVNSNISSSIKSFKDSNDLISIRIGLHFGPVIVGDIGSKHKLNYTIIGDNVNLASRLEGINKYYNTKICMSSVFLNSIDDKTQFLFRKLDKIVVKGKESSILIYELFPVYVQTLGAQEIDLYKKFIDKFEVGLDEYFLGHFDYAITYFKEAIDLKTDPVSEVFIKRCEYLIENKPTSWDGVRKFSEK